MTTISNYDIPFLFRTLYDRSRLFSFMTMPFLSQRFCSSVRTLTEFPCGIFGNEWVVLRGLGVSVINEYCGLKGRFVRIWRISNFLAGEIPYLLGCEFKNNKARHSSCWSYFAFFKVRSPFPFSSLWVDCSTIPLDWWYWELTLWNSGPLSVISSLGMPYCENIFSH